MLDVRQFKKMVGIFVDIKKVSGGCSFGHEDDVLWTHGNGVASNVRKIAVAEEVNRITDSVRRR